MNKKPRYLFLIILALLSNSFLLHADDFFLIKKKVLDESRFKLGFLYLSPLLLLENVGYVSSIYTYDETEHPDWTGDFGLGMRASAIAANRVILQAEDLPYYSFYLENKDLRTWSNRFEAKAYSYAGPFNFKAGFKRNDLRQRPQLEFSRPYHYSDSEWSGSVDIGSMDSFFVTAYGAFKELAFDEDPYLENYNLADRLNHREDVLGLRLNKHVFTSTIVYLDYEHTDYRFDVAGERDTKAQQVALGVRFPEIGALTGSFQIGIRRFEPNNPLYQRVQKPSGRGNIGLLLGERLRLNATYELDTRFSYSSSDLFYDNNIFGLGGEIYFTRFLKGGARYSDGRMKYRSFIDLKLQRSDRVRQQSYYLATPVLRNLALGFSYNVYRLTSDALGLDYTRDFWGGFISYEF